MQNRHGRPSIEFLSEFAPEHLWELAFKQADNGPLRRYNVGAVIFDSQSGRVLSSAANAFPHEAPYSEAFKPAIHAEASALSFLPRTDLRGTAVLTVATKKKNGGHCASSQPCASCLAKLAERGVEQMVFVERGEEDWFVHTIEVDKHYEQHSGFSSDAKYARLMQLPRLTAVAA